MRCGASGFFCSSRVCGNVGSACRRGGRIPPDPGRDDMKIAQPFLRLGLRREFSCALPSLRDGVSQARGTHSVPTGRKLVSAVCPSDKSLGYFQWTPPGAFAWIVPKGSLRDPSRRTIKLPERDTPSSRKSVKNLFSITEDRKLPGAMATPNVAMLRSDKDSSRRTLQQTCTFVASRAESVPYVSQGQVQPAMRANAAPENDSTREPSTESALQAPGLQTVRSKYGHIACPWALPGISGHRCGDATIKRVSDSMKFPASIRRHVQPLLIGDPVRQFDGLFFADTNVPIRSVDILAELLHEFRLRLGTHQ